MTTQEVANKLVEYCKSGQEEKVYQEFYSPNIVSMESSDEGGFETSEGMEAVQKKGEWWKENFEVHSVETSNPIVADDFFSVSFTMDTTFKPTGKREKMSEIAVYEVKDGKIVKEQFFYKKS